MPSMLPLLGRRLGILPPPEFGPPPYTPPGEEMMGPPLPTIDDRPELYLPRRRRMANVAGGGMGPAAPVYEDDPTDPGILRSSVEGLPPAAIPQQAKEAMGRDLERERDRYSIGIMQSDREARAREGQLGEHARSLQAAGFSEPEVAAIVKRTAGTPAAEPLAPPAGAPPAGPSTPGRRGLFDLPIAEAQERPEGLLEDAAPGEVPAKPAETVATGKTGAKDALAQMNAERQGRIDKARRRLLFAESGDKLAAGLAGIGGANVRVEPGVSQEFAAKDLDTAERELTPEVRESLRKKYGIDIPAGLPPEFIPHVLKLHEATQGSAGRPASDAAIQNVADLDSQIDALEEVLAEKESEGYLTGPIDERFASFGENFDANPKRAAWKSKLTNVTNSIISRLSGANVPPHEMERLRQSLPLPTDNDETFKQKVQATITESRRLRDKYSQGFAGAGKVVAQRRAGGQVLRIPRDDADAIREAREDGIEFEVE